MAVEAQSAVDLEYARKESEVKQENEKRAKNVGTRMFVGKTRGKGSQVITYENFDDSIPESLPTSIQQFMDVTNQKDEPALVKFLIAGYNADLYQAASDPLKEFVDPTWPEDAQTQFRLVVRNYSRGANVSLDDAVELIKPGFVKQFSKK